MRREDRAGFYITVIFHLVLVIVLLACQLGYTVSRENSFLLDFSRQEDIEKLRRELAFKEQVSRHLDELIASSSGDAAVSSVRNVAVDRGALKDDRGTDAEQLYKDAEQLQKDIRSRVEIPSSDEDYVPVSTVKKTQDEKEAESSSYSGPSVVSYQLEGRKASRLSIPAYRCMGAGEVTVTIAVDNAGNVILAKIQDEVSSSDACLRSFAIRAARSSRFSSSPSAPARQMGNIVYAFIAQ